MKRKLLSAVLCAAMTATMVAGCGNNNTAANNTPANNAADDSAADDTQVSDDASVPVSDEVVTLTMWGAEEDQALLTTMVESFKAANPDQEFDITIGVQSESTAKDTVLTDVEAAADVYAFADDQLNELVAAGALQAVQDVDTVSSENTPASVDAASIDGTLYAYPITADNGYFMFYDKSIFSEEDVASLDTMMEKAAAAGKTVAMDWTSAWYIYSFFKGAGLDVTLSDDGVTNVCNWNAADTDIKGTDVAQAMLDIASNPGFKSMTDAEIQTGMADGTVAAAVDGTWASVAAESAWGENLGAVKLPTYTVAGEQVQMASFSGFKMLGVNANSQNVGWAMELAKWVSNEENQTLRFTERGQGPSNINAAADADSVAIQAVVAQSEFAHLQRVGGNYWDPVATFGAIMVDGNSEGQDLQTLLDNTVDGIVAPVVE